MRLVPGLLLATLFLGWTSTTNAEVTGDTSRAMARSLGQEGLTALDRGDLTTALDRFNRAYTLHPVPTLALWTGRVLAKSGKLVAASERLREAARLSTAGGDQELQLRAQRDAAAELEVIGPRIPSLRIEIAAGLPEGSELFVDGAKIPTAVIGSPMPIDPGDHQVELHAEGRTATARASVAEGDHRVVALSFDARSDAGPPRKSLSVDAGLRDRRVALEPKTTSSGIQRTAGWVSMGIGAAGLATWGVSGLLVLRQSNALERNCVGGQCAPEYHDDLSRFRTWRTVSTVGFVAGLAGVGAGAILVLTAPRPTERGSATRRGRDVRWFGAVNVDGLVIGGDY